MKRLMLLLMVMCASVSMFSQNTLKINVLRKVQGQDIGAQNVALYSFLTEKSAKDLVRKLEAYDPVNKKKDRFIDQAVTATRGYAELECDEYGFLVVDLSNLGGGIKLVRIADLKCSKSEGDVLVATYRIEVNSEEAAGRTYEDLKIEEKSKVRKGAAVRAKRMGKTMVFNGEAVIDSAYARADARYVLDLQLVLPNDSNRLISRFAPVVLDGEDYDKAMLRRMGYDWTRDKLSPYFYVDKDSVKHFMKSGKGDVLKFSRTIYPFNASLYYNCYGHEWYEDFNNVYHHNGSIVWPGTWTDFSKFLNWNEARVDVPIDTLRYSVASKDERIPGGLTLKLEFEVGSAKLASDSMTQAEYARMLSLIDGFYYSDGDSYMTPEIIRGMASPEGTEQGNIKLSNERARYIMNMLLTRYPDRNRFRVPRIEAGVVPWEVVADTLMARGDDYSIDCADKIKAIIATHKTLDAQSRRIASEPWYTDYIKPQILPALRRIEFQYSSVTRRTLSPDEILARYEKKKNNTGELSLLYYEYYHTMRMLADEERWDELERVSREAMKVKLLEEEVVSNNLDPKYYGGLTDYAEISEKEIEKQTKAGVPKDSVIVPIVVDTSAVYSRPYPLAAYYMALSKLKRGKVDKETTKILLPYFDFSKKGMENHKLDFDQQDRGWWNDAAFVVLQILIYCADDDYVKAMEMIDQHLSANDSRIKVFRLFVECMNGDNYSKPEIIEAISNTSPMNAIAIFLAQESPVYYSKVQQILDGDLRLSGWKEDAEIDTADARSYYTRAICNYQIKCTHKGEDAPLMDKQVAFDEDHEMDYATPIFEAFKRDESWHSFFQRDGYFNSAYRVLVNYFWKRMKDGVDMPQIAKEYEALRTKYNMIKK